jgi:hypothetical protein
MIRSPTLYREYRESPRLLIAIRVPVHACSELLELHAGPPCECAHPATPHGRMIERWFPRPPIGGRVGPTPPEAVAWLRTSSAQEFAWTGEVEKADLQRRSSR